MAFSALLAKRKNSPVPRPEAARSAGVVAPRALVHKTYTCMHRYAELFRFISQIKDGFDLPLTDILSFGCASGEECLTMKELFPQSKIVGTDVLEDMVAASRNLCAKEKDISILSYKDFWADNRQYDLICCMSVLLELQYQFMPKPQWHAAIDKGQESKIAAYAHVIAKLKVKFPFSEFEHIVGLLDAKLKPGGILMLHNANYRFMETRFAAHYDPILLPGKNYETIPKWHRDDQPALNDDYTEVIFRKAR